MKEGEKGKYQLCPGLLKLAMHFPALEEHVAENKTLGQL